MGAKQKNSEETVELLFPTTGYKKTLFFNKFAIEDAGVGLFLGFWFLNRGGGVADEFGCFISKTDAARLIDSFERYVEKLNIIPTDLVDGMISGTCLKQAPIVRQIRCARVSDVAELDLSFFPLAAVVGQKSKVGEIQVEPVAALLSDLQTHVNFVCRFLQALKDCK